MIYLGNQQVGLNNSQNNEFVSYIENQELTNVQKERARDNIGAGREADVSELRSAVGELAENGYYMIAGQMTYMSLTSGQISSNSSAPINQTISTNGNTGYIIIPKAQIPTAILYDTTKYKANTVFVKNNYQISGTYTSWQTTSPVQYTEPSDYDAIALNVRKLSGNFTAAELGEALYYIRNTVVGNLVTKAYLTSYNFPGGKCIYPDGFNSRIKPNIYYNGKYYADLDINSYKIAGTGDVWVATDGNDTTGDGTESNPYLTITKALSTNAVNVRLKSGTYSQGTHYTTDVDFAGRNVIGVGDVVLQNDSSGHYVKVNASAYVENIVFKHGSQDTNSPFAAICSQSGQTICIVGCTFRDGAQNGLSVNGVDVIAVNCVSYGNKLDGFNYHDRTVNNVTYVPNVLEIDCVAYNNGSDQSGSDSCNGSTAHDGTKIIRLNGEYYSCYGGVIAEIARTGEEPTKSVNYGVLAHDSTGVGTYKASFWASVNTEMYLYDCSSYGGTYDISAINDAKVVSWRLTTGRNEPMVNEAATATVVQH